MAGAGRDRVHSIFKVKAEGRTRLIVLDTKDLSLGRSAENDLAFDDPEMSRRHATFERTEEGCRLRDLGTPNGTEVNGQSMDHALLASGDRVRVGGIEITYAETARNPASLGGAIEYASQLKAFSVSLPEGPGDATMLGELPLAGSGELDDALELLGGESSLELSGGALAPAAALQVWELDEEALGGLDVERPAGTGPLQLQLEIEGLDGELRRALLGLSGKTIDLARLRLRIRASDD